MDGTGIHVLVGFEVKMAQLTRYPPRSEDPSDFKPVSSCAGDPSGARNPISTAGRSDPVSVVHGRARSHRYANVVCCGSDGSAHGRGRLQCGRHLDTLTIAKVVTNDLFKRGIPL